MLLNEVESEPAPRPSSRREMRASVPQLAAAPSVSRSSRAEQRPQDPSLPWHRERPLSGGVLLVVGGIAIFFSGRLDLGQFRVQLGTDGLQSIIVPALLVILGILAVALPRMHVTFGVAALIVALYSLVGVNLGGFLIGMIISSIGGVLVVAWMRPGSHADEGGGESRSERRTGRKSS